MRALSRLRDRRHASVGWKLKHDNPRHLSRAQFEHESRLHGAALAQVLRDDARPGPIEVAVARREQERRRHQAPPPLTREQQVALLTAEAYRASAARSDAGRRRLVY